MKTDVKLVDIAPAAITQGELDCGNSDFPNKDKPMTIMDAIKQRLLQVMLLPA